MGRPRASDKSVTVSVRLLPAVKERIDKARGDVPLGEWLRVAAEMRLMRAENPPPPLPQPAQPTMNLLADERTAKSPEVAPRFKR